MKDFKAPKIPLKHCEDRRLYRIQSRNLGFGVFHEASGGFIGIREKFGDQYLFKEYHYDNGPPFGTVFPTEALELLPAYIANSDAGTPPSICGSCGVGATWTASPTEHVGAWSHTALTACTQVKAYHNPNTALFQWLKTMEAKYVVLSK